MSKKEYETFIKQWINNNMLKKPTSDNVESRLKLLLDMGINPCQDYQSRIGGIDFHIHSLHSDGKYSVEDIVFASEFLGLKAISITDHNTLKAYRRKIKSNIFIVPGIEINSIYKNQKIHILVYGNDILQDEFKAVINKIQLNWNKRFVDILNNINQKTNLNLSFDTYHCKNETYQYCDIVNIIKKEEKNRNIDLKEFYTKNNTCYIKSNSNYLPNTLELIKELSNINCTIELAHTKKQFIVEHYGEIIEMINNGLSCIELFHPLLDEDDRKYIYNFAQEHKLNVLGGSDYHNKNSMGILGLCNTNTIIPFALYQKSILNNKRTIFCFNSINPNEMDLDEKIALLILPNWNTFSFLRSDLYALNQFGVNYGRISKNEINSLKELSIVTKCIVNAGGIPMLIDVNQEGGRLNTVDFNEDIIFNGNRQLGKLNDLKLVHNAAYSMGKELKLLGINFNYAPVCDILNNKENTATGNRCFGNDVEVVSDCVYNFVVGMNDSGVATTAKHFPGIGSTKTDSHFDIPRINSIERDSIKPFIAAINARVPSVMISNLIINELDSKRPALMSKKTIQYLRNELNYNGVIITENITIPSLLELKENPGKIAVECLKSGADLILYNPTFSKEKNGSDYKKSVETHIKTRNEIFDEIKKALLAGEINLKSFNDSIKRVAKLYNNYGLFDSSQIDYNKYLVTNKSNYRLRMEISNKSVNYIINRIEQPIEKNNICLIKYICKESFRADSSWKYSMDYNKIFSEKSVDVDIIQTNTVDNRLLSSIMKYKTIIIITYNAHFEKQQIDFVNKILALNKRTIIIGTGDDAEIEYFKTEKIDAYIATYDVHKCSIKCAVDKLFK